MMFSEVTRILHSSMLMIFAVSVYGMLKILKKKRERLLHYYSKYIYYI